MPSATRAIRVVPGQNLPLAGQVGQGPRQFVATLQREGKSLDRGFHANHRSHRPDALPILSTNRPFISQWPTCGMHDMPLDGAMEDDY